MTRFLECGVLLRLYTMVMSGLYCFTALTQPETLSYRVAHANEFATNTMWGLGILALLGSIDLLVNDLMPAHYTIPRALRDRHLVSMAIALCFSVEMFTAVSYNFSKAILPFYAVYALMVPISAFTDVRKRFKPTQAC